MNNKRLFSSNLVYVIIEIRFFSPAKLSPQLIVGTNTRQVQPASSSLMSKLTHTIPWKSGVGLFEKIKLLWLESSISINKNTDDTFFVMNKFP